MANDKIYSMLFSKVYPLLIAKAERKGRTKEEVYAVTQWLTGYTPRQLEEMLVSDITYSQFFDNASSINPNAELIKGSICGVKIELIEEPMMKKIRWLDKLVDELAKGKAIEKIMR